MKIFLLHVLFSVAAHMYFEIKTMVIKHIKYKHQVYKCMLFKNPANLVLHRHLVVHRYLLRDLVVSLSPAISV